MKPPEKCISLRLNTRSSLVCQLIKVNDPRVQTFYFEKKRLAYGRHLTCKYLKIMLFNSETKKIEYFLDPAQKAQGYERSRYRTSRTSVFL